MAFLKPTFEWRQHPRRPNWQQLWLITPCSCGDNFAKPFAETWSGHLGVHCEKCGIHTHFDVLREAPCDWTVEWKNVPGSLERVDNGKPWRELEIHFSSRCHECGFELHDTIDCPRCGWQGGSRSEAIDKKVEKLLHEAAIARLVQDRNSNRHDAVVICPCCGDDINVFHGNDRISCRRCRTEMTVKFIPNLGQVRAQLEKLGRTS
ncbi:MAG: hypothetical protein UW63_C0043G0013 [Candidatus Uhrbacteria bacterium GW2011_GWF2_44_350]|uniref:Uncharacterized protein n=1 Tax=Candidatus Uhrbacteria bacterium GW2011_GWF2_44_350 TaxID=1619000 RepID=A0A0G1JEU3_9BACT|nr:MAG: hypothetical protein UW63_C0043G0013 [Candidatus Uhrbacteria bacterium GW2011_GWF2_44_350]HBR80097.1 hypothetical protein [Candidatus Uhrbacteria bacterium]HCU32203.1 hypothetical protein [Candidatus Uhrbacteria bacterium]